MRHVFYKLKVGIKDAAGLGSISAIRWAEQRLSPRTFYAGLRAVFWVRAALNNLFKKTAQPPPMPDFLRTPRTFKTRIQQRTDFYLNEVIVNFPDRLAAPKWKAHCQVEGLAHLEAARKNGRLVVLAYCHFGVYPVVHCWLRALGVPVGGLVGGNATMRTHHARLQDKFLPLPEVPVAMYLDELRELARFFRAGNVLYMAVDVPTGKQIAVPFCDGWDFEMATGAIRFASRYEADIIPCSITDEGGWHYRITLGKPVPRELLVSESDWALAGKCLLDEMLPLFKARPDQCWDAMTKRLVRKTGRAGKN